METGNIMALAGGEIHGFNSTADLDVVKLMEDATMRWLRPNEVHAILSNYTLFKIQPQPIDNPPSGMLLLFDRKMLRNFRKDGHNWRKKKDGKTVQEAHEKLKIGNEERIHVYYARNEDDPNFYRRCYWLLDRDFEHIVLVHYRQTSEENANKLPSLPPEPKEASHAVNSPVTPLNSTSGSQSDISGSIVDSVERYMINDVSSGSPAPGIIEPKTRTVDLDELDKLGWGDIIEHPVRIDSSPLSDGPAALHDVAYRLKESRGKAGVSQKARQSHFSGVNKQNKLPFWPMDVQGVTFENTNKNCQEIDHQIPFLVGNETVKTFSEINQTQSEIGPWNCIDSPDILDCPSVRSHPSITDIAGRVQLTNHNPCQGPAFTITEISPTQAYAGEETKVLVIGSFNESNKHLVGSKMSCCFGDECFPAEQIQVGVFRVVIFAQEPGTISFYMTVDGQTPISEIIYFECHNSSSTSMNSTVTSPSIESARPKYQELRSLKRLAHLLFSTTNCLSVLSSRISANSLKEVKRFASLTSSSLEHDWMDCLAQNNDGDFVSPANLNLIELLLKSKLQEWLLLRMAEGCKVTPRDTQGQGAIHLCAILDYAWAVRLFLISGFSLDFRDSRGWTALHWAAYYGREKMAAALLSAGANPSLVTDPLPDFPGGCTAGDLASIQGYEGLGAYLAEKGLQAHYEAMANSGNASSPQRHAFTDLMMPISENPENLSEQELCLKDSLAAYRNAADAADRIQAAFREKSHKQQMKAAQLENPKDEAESIVAALKIQKAYRNYDRRRQMKAAARIQGIFRTWQARRNFLNLRRQVIKIQAVFRGHQVRKQYQKICWSVGVLEKAVLRWRLKRKGLRGLQGKLEISPSIIEEENCVEEDFYRVSREQAEERVQRSVVRVQAMFRSYRAQQEYRRIKMAYNQAKLEFELMDDDMQQV